MLQLQWSEILVLGVLECCSSEHELLSVLGRRSVGGTSASGAVVLASWGGAAITWGSRLVAPS